MIVKRVITVIQLLLILLFLCCVGYIGKYFYDAYKAQEGFEILQEEVREHTPPEDTAGNEEQYAENGMLIQYYELHEKNNDLKGWIKIDGTPIDYPVMQAKDNDYYLHRDFYKNYQFSGIPFLDYDCSDTSMNSIIYAHNMKNGTMFAAVSEYDDKDFYNAHKTINYDTLYERGEYEIMSVFRTKVGSKNEFKYYEYANIDTKDAFDEFVAKAKSLAVYNTGVNAEFGDNLLTLSTCAYHTSNERLVIVACKKHE